MVSVSVDKVAQTRGHLLDAAQRIVMEHGYAGLSTRRVAEAANMPMSQIQYHFGSKEGMVLALFEELNNSLLVRQQALFGDPALPLSRQWALACDFLEDDLNSGYVQVQQELIAAGWSNPAIRDAVARALDGWQRLLVRVARRALRRLGVNSPFPPEEIAALVSVMFFGAEAQILLGRDGPQVPNRAALRRIGAVIETLETRQKDGG